MSKTFITQNLIWCHYSNNHICRSWDSFCLEIKLGLPNWLIRILLNLTLSFLIIQLNHSNSNEMNVCIILIFNTCRDLTHQKVKYSDCLLLQFQLSRFLVDTSRDIKGDIEGNLNFLNIGTKESIPS